MVPDNRSLHMCRPGRTVCEDYARISVELAHRGRARRGRRVRPRRHTTTLSVGKKPACAPPATAAAPSLSNSRLHWNKRGRGLLIPNSTSNAFVASSSVLSSHTAAGGGRRAAGGGRPAASP
ncbi:hypothetical protein EVAR_64901_1 [Eumeta japonica]|uniref:Uncharacterized protein n=1 Tax=Eumeta variegata TaxID=151549 RepID=A0A4C1ZTV7_EUMVA|nr:hypothetical protein EVAR_64901_1 [Eumeta japonica]